MFKKKLGRATWNFLHTFADGWNDNLANKYEKDLVNMIEILARIYPCRNCSKHFIKVLESNPVEAHSGRSLRRYLCKVHNIVNEKLGKTIYDCELKYN